MSKVLGMARALAREEDGASLAEYLVLLGVVTVAVVGGIGLFGTALGVAFTDWATWIGTNASPPPDIVEPPA